MERKFSRLALLVLCVALVLSACGGPAAPSTAGGGTVNQPAGTGSSGQGQATAGSGLDRQPTTAAAPTTGPAGLHAPGNGLSAAEPPASHLPQPQATPAAGHPVAEEQVPGTPNATTGPYDQTTFQHYGTNPFINTQNDHLSTFAMDVDTASYSLMRRFLTDGHLPAPESVRVEEYLNYFDYRYPDPDEGSFSITMEAGPSPFGESGDVMLLVGLQGRSIDRSSRKPAALTFVVDISGSMGQDNRLDIVKQSLELLVGQMGADDTIAIAAYGSTARAVLPPTPGTEGDRILSAIRGLQSEGATNVQAGLDVGFALADEAYRPDSINMVLLCSDGVANNGVTDPDLLLTRYQRYTDHGIQLSTFGVGMGNFNDVMMERLANKGDGAYAYIDSVEQAYTVFGEHLTGTLQSIARDAKIQLDFSPATVSSFRLLGYENRAVADRDFRNDQVDAGEVGAGHSVTALYEIKRVPGANGPLATARLRYQPPEGGKVIEQVATLKTEQVHSSMSDTSARFKLALGVAQYAEVLRQSHWAKDEVLEDVRPLVEEALGGFGEDRHMSEFLALLGRAISLNPTAR